MMEEGGHLRPVGGEVTPVCHNGGERDDQGGKGDEHAGEISEGILDLGLNDLGGVARRGIGGSMTRGRVACLCVR